MSLSFPEQTRFSAKTLNWNPNVTEPVWGLISFKGQLNELDNFLNNGLTVVKANPISFLVR